MNHPKKDQIKHDIRHLYLPGFTTLKSLAQTYGISSDTIAKYEKQVINEIREEHKEKKYLPEQRETLLGELMIGETFIPKENQNTKFAYDTYRVIRRMPTKALVRDRFGKDQWIPNTLKVVIRNVAME